MKITHQKKKLKLARNLKSDPLTIGEKFGSPFHHLREKPHKVQGEMNFRRK